MIFASKVAKYVKSNAIVFAKNKTSIGIGAGQMSRIDAAKLASKKAIEIGIDNPVIGVGAGNYAIIPKEIEPGSFSHNTFTEVFANFGIIGLIIYLKMLLLLTFKILKNFRTKNIKIRIINYQFLLFFLGFLIYNTLYVVYLSTIFMHFLFVIYAHIVYIDRQIKLQQN